MPLSPPRPQGYDPQSPCRYGTCLRGRPRGLISHAFPALCPPTLALPFRAGRSIGGTRLTGVIALLWAGLVRIALLTFGASRHHLRHADPTSARLLERPGRVHDARWPSPARVAARRA